MLVSGTRMCLQQSSGCLGGYVRPPPAALPEKVPQRKHRRWSKRRVRGQSAHSPQSWWMSSSNEMDDHSVLNSRSLQKLSKATNFCQDAGSHRNNTNNNISNNSTFVNHGIFSLSLSISIATQIFLFINFSRSKARVESLWHLLGGANAALMSWNEQRRDWVAKKTKEQPQSQELREPVIGLALLPHIGLLFSFSMPRLHWVTSDAHGLKCVGWTYLKVVPLTWKRVLQSLISRHSLYIPPEELPVVYLSGVDMWWYDWLLAAD